MVSPKLAKIPFTRPFTTGKEFELIDQVRNNNKLCGDGMYTKQCHEWLETQLGCKKALLTHSCTAALEMSAILAGVEPGDEVIMPSYTFVSTANAFVLRGAVPVFVDIRPDTLNLDETLIESAITKHTRAIVPVHYAGVGCEMDTFKKVADKHNLLLIEDAAQGLMGSYKGTSLGSIGQMGCLSFHETKNIISGEGGALLINDEDFIERAEIIREKGTNRSKFFRGSVDKYTWVDLGSSYLPSDIIAAFLYAQFQEAIKITDARLEIWNEYHRLLEPLEASNILRRPIIPHACEHNAHMYYVLLKDLKTRMELIEHLKTKNIQSVFHYIPLHSAPAGIRYGRSHGELIHTDDLSERLLRLPLFLGLSLDKVAEIVSLIKAFLK